MDDVTKHSTRRLTTILRNPDHPMHSAAKAEMDRRSQKTEGAMKRMVTTQSNKADRMASTDKKGLETYKKKVDEISLDMLTKKIANSGMKSTKKAMGADKTKKDLEAMKARLQTEKTLTPAEKRKREKIAKAIEKDNPNMPMDKKMAIATATAKRVAEGKVDEVSSNTLSNYMRKSAASAGKPGASARTQDKRIGGQKMADDKIRKKMGYSSQAKVPAGTNEATDMGEQKVNELKKSTLASYIKKASDDRAKNAYDIGKSGKINYKGLKRRQGINRAVNKMANEENIDEVLDTPQAMQSYRDKNKRSKEKAANSAAAKILRGPDASGNRADHSAELKTMAKRRSGEKMADRNAGRKTFKMLRGKK